MESSQTRTSLRVRVLTQRLMRQKQKQSSTELSSLKKHTNISKPLNSSLDNTSPSNFDLLNDESVQGSEAALLASMREGTSISLPCDFAFSIC